MLSWKRIGLRGRAIAFCCLLVLGSVGILSTALNWQSYRHSIHCLSEQAVASARSLAHGAEPAILLNDLESLSHIAQDALHNRAVEALVIIDTHGNILASAGRTDDCSCRTELDLQRPIAGIITSASARVQRFGDEMLVTVPIWIEQESSSTKLPVDDKTEAGRGTGKSAGLVGSLCLIYSLDAVESALMRNLTSSAAVSLVVIGLGIAMTLVVARRLLGPIKDLAQTTAAVAEGNFQTRVCEGAAGEIGELARSFNHMADRLQESYASIERKVIDRTAELEAQRTELRSEVAERKRTEKKLSSQARRQAVIAELAYEALGDVAPTALFDKTVRLLAQTLAVDCCKVLELLPEGDALLLRAGVGWREGLVGHATVGADVDSQAGFTLTSDEPVVVDDLRTETRFTGPPLLLDHGVISGMSIIIAGKKRHYGILSVHTTTKRTFTEEEVQFLETVANLLATSIERRNAESMLRTNAKLLRGQNAEVEARRHQMIAQQEDLLDANRALEEAMGAAEAANLAKSEFLANMSHEIRTPMTAIMGFADVLLEHGNLDEAPPERIDAARTIKRNGVYLLSIINDILDLSKIEAGKFAIERIDCSPAHIAAEVRSLMLVRADEKGLPFHVEFDGPVPETIRSDPIRLKQILVNLIGNAVKFTRSGSVRLVTSLVHNDSGEPHVQFDVIDTGVGMTDAHLARVFEPFTQADSSTTRTFGGTGLGLAISKRLASLLGGDISAVSIPGEGSTFHLTVATGPLDDVKMLDNPAAAATVEPLRPPAPTPDRAPLCCRVLLAEDGLDNQRLIAYLLKKAGARVTIAENGKLALEAALAARAEADAFDVILMDMQMPVMDGYEATRRLRREGYDKPIIALTAHAMASDRQKCLDAGCNDYATKPIERKALIEIVVKYLARPDAESDEDHLSVVLTTPAESPEGRGGP